MADDSGAAGHDAGAAQLAAGALGALWLCVAWRLLGPGAFGVAAAVDAALAAVAGGALARRLAWGAWLGAARSVASLAAAAALVYAVVAVVIGGGRWTAVALAGAVLVAPVPLSVAVVERRALRLALRALRTPR